MSIQPIPSNLSAIMPAQAVYFAFAPTPVPLTNDEITMMASLFLYRDGRLLVSNVILTTDYILEAGDI